jgi:hypothetical protein
VSRRKPHWAVDWPTLRAKPERLLLPLAAIWLLVNVAPWGFGTDYIVAFYSAFTLQKTDAIFPFTYAFAIATFVGLMWAGLRWTDLGVARSFVLAGTVPFAGPGAFEIVFQEVGAAVHPGLFVGYAVPYVMFSYATWVLLGLVGLGWWRTSLGWELTLVFTLVGFAIWIALGFPLVTMGNFVQLPEAYLLNITLKAALYLVFALPVLEGMHAYRNHPGSAPELAQVAAATDLPGSQPTAVSDHLE